MVAVRGLRHAGPVRRHHGRASLDPRECGSVRCQPHGPVPGSRAVRSSGSRNLLPGDLQVLGDMKLRYSLLLAEDGRIIDDLMATRRGSNFYVVVNGATKHDDIEHMQHRLPSYVVVDHMREQALLALQGPKAVEVLKRSCRACRSGLHAGRRVSCGRASGVDQPLRLYRRGRVRDFDPVDRGRAIAEWLIGDERGKADRARRPRFAAAGGRASALRTRHRPDDDAGHGRPRSRSASAAAPKAVSPGAMRILASSRMAAAESASALTSMAASRCAKAR